VKAQDRFALLDKLIERYNAGDADGYAAFFAEDGVEAMYRGEEMPRRSRNFRRTGRSCSIGRRWASMCCCTNGCGASRRAIRSR
jgi:hypothetical protein